MTNKNDDIINMNLNKKQINILKYLKDKDVVIKTTNNPEEFLINLKGAEVKQPTTRDLILEMRSDLIEMKADISELKTDMKLLKSLPTIKREIEQQQ